jgi:hypothetical protein
VAAGCALAAVVAVYLALIAVEQQRSGGEDGLYAAGWHVAENAWAYARRVVLPHRSSLFAADVAAGVLAVAYLAAGAWAVAARRRALAWLFAWSLLAIAPYSLFKSGTEWRYTYQAALPFAGFVALGAREALRWRPVARIAEARYAAAAVGAIALAVCVSETRDGQRWIELQARAYGSVVEAMQASCGDRAGGARVFVVDRVAWDPYGANLAAAGAYEVGAASVARGETPPGDRGAYDCVAVAR